MRLKIFIIFLIITAPLYGKGGYNELKVYPVKNRIAVEPGGSGSITLKVEIPDNSYIYSNPKGPGIGSPTTVEVQNLNNDDIIFDSPLFAKPKRHRAPGDPNFVLIYEKVTYISLPFKAAKNAKSGEHNATILVKGLTCTDKSCTLFHFKNDVIIEVFSGKSAVDSIVKTDPNAINNVSANKTENPQFPKNAVNLHILKNAGNSTEDIDSFKPRYPSSLYISNLIQAILYGFLAGLLLNFMPCVLPVISLKIMDIIRYSGQNRKDIRMMGLIFTLGILTSFLILAILAGFLGYGWGGHFQQGLFIIIMTAVVFILALSMFDVFTINIPSFAGKAGHSITNKYIRTYSKGLLATLLATPCSGPFLGGTLAWALTQSPSIIIIIFISVGLGMSAPYMILTANPVLIKFIPKPGKWMIIFENIMGFLLFGTAVYLIGILQDDMVMPTVAFMLFIAFSFWQYGRFGSIEMPLKKRIISRIAVIIIILTGYFISYRIIYTPEQGIELTASDKKPFSTQLLFRNRDEKKISMVVFTADWCPNCKLVEKTSLYTLNVQDKIRENNIDFMVADITRENPEASALLKKLGSNSIPFLAIFPSNDKFYNPICLRDIYSEKDVLEAIEMAK